MIVGLKKRGDDMWDAYELRDEDNIFIRTFVGTTPAEIVEQISENSRDDVELWTLPFQGWF